MKRNEEWSREGEHRHQRRRIEEEEGVPPALGAVEDDLERTFEIRRGVAGPTEAWSLEEADFAAVADEFDAALMVAEGRWVAPRDVLALWTQKTRMDPLFARENRRTGAYTAARDALFAADVRGSRTFRNRAGDKLLEVLEASGMARALARPRPLLLFADVCGGPGAFSEVVFRRCAGRAARVAGVGVTLRAASGGTADWYAALARDPRFRAVYGPGGRGDAYDPATLAALDAALRAEDARGAYAVLADGGFTVASDDRSVENIQELYTARLLLAELVAAAQSLRPGGHFVCKLFDTFSDFSASLLYCCTLLFDAVRVVKPARSRTVNSERYLAASGFRADAAPGGPRRWLVDHLRALHARAFAAPQPRAPRALAPVARMLADDAFRRSLRHLNSTLVQRQTHALTAVLDHVDWSRVVPVPVPPNPQGPRFVLPPILLSLRDGNPSEGVSVSDSGSAPVSSSPAQKDAETDPAPSAPASDSDSSSSPQKGTVVASSSEERGSETETAPAPVTSTIERQPEQAGE